MSKRAYLILLTMLFITKGNSQNIINGDFEINTADTCLWNLTDAAYNDTMSNSWSFGNNTGSGIDIEQSSCGLYNSPSNIWFVSLSKNNNSFWQNDELSLELDTNLIVGNTYQISYFENAELGSGNFNIPIEIGLSTDSLNFGQLIHSSLPIANVWTHRTFNFIAPNNGKYLTVHNEPLGTLQAWNSVDNFQIISLTGMNDVSFNQTFSIYPNPFSNSTTISFSLSQSQKVSLKIFDVNGRLVSIPQGGTDKIFEAGEHQIEFNAEKINAGIYFLQFQSAENLHTKKLIVTK